MSGNTTSGIESDTRWVAPDWRWNCFDGIAQATVPLYVKLSDSTKNAFTAESDDLIDRNEQMMAKVARTITTAARNQLGEFRNLDVSCDLAVAILDDHASAREYNRLLR